MDMAANDVGIQSGRIPSLPVSQFPSFVVSLFKWPTKAVLCMLVVIQQVHQLLAMNEVWNYAPSDYAEQICAGDHENKLKSLAEVGESISVSQWTVEKTWL